MLPEHMLHAVLDMDVTRWPQRGKQKYFMLTYPCNIAVSGSPQTYASYLAGVCPRTKRGQVESGKQE